MILPAITITLGLIGIVTSLILLSLFRKRREEQKQRLADNIDATNAIWERWCRAIGQLGQPLHQELEPIQVSSDEAIIGLQAIAEDLS